MGGPRRIHVSGPGSSFSNANDLITRGFQYQLPADINLDGAVDLLDFSPFVELLTNQNFQAEADFNQDRVVDLLDVEPLVAILAG